MSNRLTHLGTMILLAFVSWPLLHCNAAAPLLEDHEPYREYRVIGDRVLLKNPNASVEPIHLMYRTQDGLGTTWWDEDMRLTYYDGNYALQPSVAVTDSCVHVFWVGDRVDRLFRVFYMRSTDLGGMWEEGFAISDTLQEQEHTYPDIALSTNCLHAVWDYLWKPIGEDGHIYYRRSLSNGSTWEDIYYLSSYDHQTRPSIAALRDTIYVIFGRYIQSQELYQMHFRKSYDEGETWAGDRVIADYGPYLIRGTLYASRDGLHYVFNHDDNFEDPNNPYASKEVFYIHSPDFGETWTDPIIVSHRDSIHSQWPSMCVDDEGTVHVTWFDYKYSPYSWTGDIFYTKSTNHESIDDGRFWSDIQVLTDSHLSRWSNIIARGNHLYLVFEDERHGNHNNEVYFRHSPDRGRSWDPEERLTNAGKESYTPVVTEQHDTLYVVWDDHRDDPANIFSEIYFKRGGLTSISLKKTYPADYGSYLSCYPNPFNDRVIIQYEVCGPDAISASVKVYNVRGQLVRTLLDRDLAPGNYQAAWDGTDPTETEVSSGVYLCVLNLGQSRFISRFVYLK